MESEKTYPCCFEDEAYDIESAILCDGINFQVNYIGCVEIFTSMKLLDFQSRSLVAKECINRVCDAANVRSPKKRRVEKRVQQCVSTEPCLEHSGKSVYLNISSQSLELTSIDANECISKHDMPNISFASGGDSDSSNFVAYVAKDTMGWRACYVLECGDDKAQSVISSIGQAFELRYKTVCSDSLPRGATRKQAPPKSDTEYYNDLPDKMPPEFSSDSGSEKRRERLTSNLIDLNNTSLDKCDYVNDNCSDESGCNYNNNNITNAVATRDVFDMQCFSLSPEVQYSQLLLENWFHGSISRSVAESFLRHDGDFLVRESQGSSNQYVLTGLNAGQPKHLLLIDPEGVVRTKDRVFDNVTHLINYHWTNRLPIISADSALLLQAPVIRTTVLRK